MTASCHRFSWRRPDLGLMNRAGFTLIELMVAIILFAVVSTAVYSSYAAIVRTTNGLYERLDRLESARTCILRIRADLADILVTQADQFITPDKRQDPDLFRVLAETDTDTGSVRFSFASMAHLPFSEAAQPEPVRIIYSAKKDDNGQWVLYRDQHLLSAEAPMDRPAPKLAMGLSDLVWSFDTSDGQSRDRWDSDSAEAGYATPRVIRLKFTFGPGKTDSNSASESYSLAIALPVFRKAAP